MKKSLFLLLLISMPAFSSPLGDKEILGKWKLEVNLEETIKEEVQEMNLIEKMIIRGVSGMVQSVWEEIHITFEFKKNQVLLLHVEVDLDEKDKEIEELAWKRKKNGKIIIDDIQNEKVDISDDGYWKLMDGKFYHFDKDGEINENIYMVKIK